MTIGGRYRIVRRLGSGGMAEVLEADAVGEAGFVRRVAIKRMLGNALEDPSFSRMFLDEARIASRLHHANIVSVLDYGIVDGSPFQVLELVDGVDARTLVRFSEGGRVPVDIALYIAAQIGHALGAAHEATDVAGEPLGIVHRDVSLGNVLVSWAGDVKLADFGIAFAKDRAEKTDVGSTKGTLGFMSPEAALTGRVDPRSDVFALGCVLHALLVGSSPLTGDALTTFLIERKLRLADDLPDDAAAIIEMATRFAPETRFQSAIAMTEAVGRALATRTNREPRRRLVEYLAPLREKASAKKVGKLDAALQLEIVAATATSTASAAAESTEMLREFRASHFPETVPSSLPVATLHPGGSPAPPLVVPPPSQRRSAALPVLLGAAGLVIVGIAALGAMRLVKSRRATVDDAHVGSTNPTPPAPATPEAPPVSTSTVSSAPPTTPSALVTAIASAARPSSTATTRAKTAPTATSTTAPSTATAAACVGTLYLSCPLAPRATVSIDGRPTSAHHGEFLDLGCAQHVVTFTTVDGKTSTRGAQVTSANTRTSPVEVRCALD